LLNFTNIFAVEENIPVGEHDSMDTLTEKEDTMLPSTDTESLEPSKNVEVHNKNQEIKEENMFVPNVTASEPKKEGSAKFENENKTASKDSDSVEELIPAERHLTATSCNADLSDEKEPITEPSKDVVESDQSQQETSDLETATNDEKKVVLSTEDTEIISGNESETPLKDQLSDSVNENTEIKSLTSVESTSVDCQEEIVHSSPEKNISKAHDADVQVTGASSEENFVNLVPDQIHDHSVAYKGKKQEGEIVQEQPAELTEDFISAQKADSASPTTDKANSNKGIEQASNLTGELNTALNNYEESAFIAQQNEEQLSSLDSTADSVEKESVHVQEQYMLSKYSASKFETSSSESSSIVSTVDEKFTKTSSSESRITSESSKSTTTSSDYKIITDVTNSATESKEHHIVETSKQSIVILDAATDDQLSSGTFSTEDISPQFTDLPVKLAASKVDFDHENNMADEQDGNTHMEEKIATADYASIQKITETRLAQENRCSSQASDISDKEIPASTPRSDITISPGPLDSGLTTSSSARFVWGDNNENLVTDTVDIMTQSIYMPSTCEGHADEESLGTGLVSEDINEPILKDPLLQMTETVLFIAASGKEPIKKGEQKECKIEEKEENGNIVPQEKKEETTNDGKGESSSSTNSNITDAASDKTKSTDKNPPADNSENKDDDPIAGWGKPLGLPSPIRPSTPAKQAKKSEEEAMDTNKVCIF